MSGPFYNDVFGIFDGKTNLSGGVKMVKETYVICFDCRKAFKTEEVNKVITPEMTTIYLCDFCLEKKRKRNK